MPRANCNITQNYHNRSDPSSRLSKPGPNRPGPDKPGPNEPGPNEPEPNERGPNNLCASDSIMTSEYITTNVICKAQAVNTCKLITAQLLASTRSINTTLFPQSGLAKALALNLNRTLQIVFI